MHLRSTTAQRPAERLLHLFRKFAGVEADDPEGDTGLGLVTCKGIVEANGGTHLGRE